MYLGTAWIQIEIGKLGKFKDFFRGLERVPICTCRFDRVASLDHRHAIDKHLQEK